MNMIIGRGRAIEVACAAAVLLGAAGHGVGAAASGYAASTPAAPASAPSLSSPAAVSVQNDVILRDFSIAIADRRLAPGTHTFRLHNAGRAPHALAIMGPGMGAVRRSETLAGGETARFTVNLVRSGTYQVWCPVDAHRGRGMETTLVVR
ncbi:hypothetical protein [Nonomuraea lactucae]|uniref:hypothetical protein n=1 Tax=Nonomuraea lactucae TaxID=2249762 RepID=UPI000DE331F4|nr:hypothetical protein [Nonomuraea lactucae]